MGDGSTGFHPVARTRTKCWTTPCRYPLQNRDDDVWVLIENQLERTDHIHLGQLLTYAASLQAVTIVWVAAMFTDEHCAVFDWLNEITDDTFRFFVYEITDFG